jgi:hypothetical protein
LYVVEGKYESSSSLWFARCSLMKPML